MLRRLAVGTAIVRHGTIAERGGRTPCHHPAYFGEMGRVRGSVLKGSVTVACAFSFTSFETEYRLYQPCQCNGLRNESMRTTDLSSERGSSGIAASLEDLVFEILL